MTLPTQDQVNSIIRHMATFAGGMITMFGLGTKINPDTLTAIINAVGNVTNDMITLVGLVAPIIATFFAAKAQSQKSQVQSVQAMPGVSKIEVNSEATPELAAMAISTTEPKVVAVPGDAARLIQTIRSSQ